MRVAEKAEVEGGETGAGVGAGEESVEGLALLAGGPRQ